MSLDCSDLYSSDLDSSDLDSSDLDSLDPIGSLHLYLKEMTKNCDVKEISKKIREISNEIEENIEAFDDDYLSLVCGILPEDRIEKTLQENEERMDLIKNYAFYIGELTKKIDENSTPTTQKEHSDNIQP